MTESTEQVQILSGPRRQALVACMGTHACGRICQREDVKPGQGEGSLPYEFVCPVLDEGANDVAPEYRNELAQAVTMPSLETLNEEEAAKEADSYLTFLKNGQTKFESYIETILKGTSLPRSTAAQVAKEWEGRQYMSPNTEKLESMTDDEKAELQIFYAQLRGFHDLDTKKREGLLFDESMTSIIRRAASELSVGHHIKLTGEPGVAKTTLAKFLGRINARASHPDWSESQCEPILISLSSTTEAEAQVSEQTFENNTLGERLVRIAKAMEEGRVIILDEQNGMTADQQVYFNDMFLKKPGQEVRVGDRLITVAPGFAVIATVNPMTDTQGNRRHGRQQQDSAGAARYSRIDIPYPGQQGYPGDAKETLTRLFYADYVDQYGWQRPTEAVIALINDCQEYLTKLTRMATEAPANGSSTSGLLNAAQARPELAECITPRDFDRDMERVMAHSSVEDLPRDLRRAIGVRTEQILHSDNGHYVSPTAINAVKQLQRTSRFLENA